MPFKNWQNTLGHIGLFVTYTRKTNKMLKNLTPENFTYFIISHRGPAKTGNPLAVIYCNAGLTLWKHRRFIALRGQETLGV